MLMIVAGASIAGCTSENQTAQSPAVTTSGERSKLLIATTTSLYDTGLLDALEKTYEAKNNVDLLITSQGTGKAIELAKRGDADILLVHSPSQELAFLEDGYGVNRRSFAYNYFIVVGPANDPVGIKGMTPEAAFTKILTEGKKGTANVFFVSRGDASGTHTAEQKIWSNAKYAYAADVQKSGAWYIEAGKGMGETLQMASEKGAYTFTDEGTFLAYAGKLNLQPLITEGSSLLNVYSVMTVNTVNQTPDRIARANAFVNFLIAPETLQQIGDFGKDTYGKGLFTPMTAGVPTGVTADFTTPAKATTSLTVYHAGSLATPFAKLEKAYEAAHPEVDVQLFSGGSTALVDKVTKQNKKPDVIASADVGLIPKYMMPDNATSYVSFAKNSIVLCYTNKSDFANEITAENWYQVITRPNVSMAISDPNADPAGYRSLMTIALAEKQYNQSLFAPLVGDHSTIARSTSGSVTVIDVTNTSPDGTNLVITKSGPDIAPLLKAGTVDYGWEYSSVAIQNGLSYLTLPETIDLSSAQHADAYKTVQVKRISGTAAVTEDATPIIYGATVPTAARHAATGIDFVKMLISDDGQKILADDGQTPIDPALGYGTIPDALKPAVAMA